VSKGVTGLLSSSVLGLMVSAEQLGVKDVESLKARVILGFSFVLDHWIFCLFSFSSLYWLPLEEVYFLFWVNAFG